MSKLQENLSMVVDNAGLTKSFLESIDIQLAMIVKAYGNEMCESAKKALLITRELVSDYWETADYNLEKAKKELQQVMEGK